MSRALAQFALVLLAVAGCGRQEEKRETLRFRSHGDASDRSERVDVIPTAIASRASDEFEKAPIKKRLEAAGYSVSGDYESDAGGTTVVTMTVSKVGGSSTGIVCIYEFPTEETARLAKETMTKSFATAWRGRKVLIAYDAGSMKAAEAMLDVAMGK